MSFGTALLIGTFMALALWYFNFRLRMFLAIFGRLLFLTMLGMVVAIHQLHYWVPGDLVMVYSQSTGVVIGVMITALLITAIANVGYAALMMGTTHRKTKNRRRWIGEKILVESSVALLFSVALPGMVIAQHFETEIAQLIVDTAAPGPLVALGIGFFIYVMGLIYQIFEGVKNLETQHHHAQRHQEADTLVATDTTLAAGTASDHPGQLHDEQRDDPAAPDHACRHRPDAAGSATPDERISRRHL